MEDALHRDLDCAVVGIDGFGVVCASGWAEGLSGSEQGLDGLASQDDQRGHRSQAGRKWFIAAGVADPANDLFAAKFLQIIGSVARAVLKRTLIAEQAHASGDVGGGEAGR